MRLVSRGRYGNGGRVVGVSMDPPDFAGRGTVPKPIVSAIVQPQEISARDSSYKQIEFSVELKPDATASTSEVSVVTCQKFYTSITSIFEHIHGVLNVDVKNRFSQRKK